MPDQSGSPLFAVEQVGDVTVVKLLPARILDEETVRTIGEQLFNLVEKEGHRQLVLNLGNVRLMISTMLAKLLMLRKKVQAAGGRLALCETNPELDEVFEALQLSPLFTIYAEEQEAVQSF